MSESTHVNLPVVQEQARERPEPSIHQLMEKAMTLGPAAVEVIERLTKLKLEMEDRQAEREFAAAFAAMQAEIPQMQKNGKNAQGQPFAEYSDVMRVLRPILEKHGFSISFDEDAVTEAGITFALKLRHVGGHFECYKRTYHIDKAAVNSSGKAIRPPIQDDGSTTSYARRYLVFQALNITADDDTDGYSPEPITVEQVSYLERLMAESQTTDAGFQIISGVKTLAEIPKRDYQRCKNALETKLRVRKS